MRLSTVKRQVAILPIGKKANISASQAVSSDNYWDTFTNLSFD